MAYSSLPSNLEEICDFTAGTFTVHADQVLREMQEHNANTKISITCLQISRHWDKEKHH